MERMSKAVGVMISVLLFLSVPTAQASEWLDDEWGIVKKMGEQATEFAATSSKVSPFTKAFAESAKKLAGFLNDTLVTVTDKTLYDPKWFEQLDEQRLAADKLMPPDLPSLNAPGAYRAMVGPAETATYLSGKEELRMLDRVGEERAKTLKGLKAERDKLKKTVDRYKAEADTAHKIGSQLNKVVEEYPGIDVAFAFTGVNGYVSLTALGWETEVEPAFNDRLMAAENALRRFDKIIKSGEADLTTFNQLKANMRSIWAGIDSQSLNPASVSMNPGQVERLKGDAEKATAEALAVSAELQKQAADIAKHNEGISRIQNFIGMAKTATDAGQLAEEAQSSAPSPTPSPEAKSPPKSKQIFKTVPGASLPIPRRGQTPIFDNNKSQLDVPKN